MGDGRHYNHDSKFNENCHHYCFPNIELFSWNFTNTKPVVFSLCAQDIIYIVIKLIWDRIWQCNYPWYSYDITEMEFIGDAAGKPFAEPIKSIPYWGLWLLTHRRWVQWPVSKIFFLLKFNFNGNIICYHPNTITVVTIMIALWL